MDKARDAALKIIYDTLENDSFLNIAYKNVTKAENFSGKDAAFIKELAFGTVSNKITIDYYLSHFIKSKSKVSPYVLNILRLGVYQLKFTDKIPPSAAVNESVKLCEKYAHPSQKGFVNAVLRNVERAEKIEFPDKNDKSYLSIKYSFTPSMTGALVKAYGKEFTEELMASLNKSPKLSVRVNILKISRDELIDKLSQKGIECEINEQTPCGIFLKNIGSLEALDEYKDGLFTVQDTASQIASLTLNPKSGDLVMDLCASPGGKTTHLAELMGNKGEILAYDLYEKRLMSVDDNAKRLGISIIKTEARDSSSVINEMIGKADKVLLDAPCSGWGVIRRKPDIKYKSEKTDYKELNLVQKALINTASKYLKAGGEMVYSTCTLNIGENERIVNSFLEENPDFTLLEKKTYFPNVDGTDGFFISKLRKKKEEE